MTEKERFQQANTNSLPIEQKVVPLFTRQKQSRPVLVGSSVYFFIDGQHFLVTAAHVVTRTGSLLFPSSPKGLDYIPTNGFAVSRSQHVDMAVAQLDGELPNYVPILFPEILDIDSATGIPARLIVAGFPSNAVDATASTVKAEIARILTTRAGVPSAQSQQIDSKFSIAADFDRTDIVSWTKPRSTFPKPQGMSGGGLFWMHQSGLTERRPCLLAGILTESFGPPLPIMIGTKIKFALAIMRNRYGTSFPGNMMRDVSARKGENAGSDGQTKNLPDDRNQDVTS